MPGTGTGGLAQVAKRWSWETFKIVASVITVVAPMMYFVAKPAAEGFIKQTMDNRIGQLERQVEEQTAEITEQSTRQEVQNERLKGLQELQKEQRDTLRRILLELQRR